MTESTESGVAAADVAAGLCLGALTGILVGLTTASVTTTVLSSVLAVATAFIGLAGDSKFLDGLVNHARVTSFAAAMTCTLLIGIWMRTHDILSPSPEALYKQLTAAEFTKDEAKDLIGLVKYGMLPEGRSLASFEQSPAFQRVSSTLFSDAPSWCDDFRRRQGQPVDEQVAWLEQQGKDNHDLVLRMKNLPSERKGEVVRSAVFYLCGLNE